VEVDGVLTAGDWAKNGWDGSAYNSIWAL
jgi:hypothetical protein